MTQNKKSQFFSEAGDSDKVESVYAVALYNPADGLIRYMHTVVTMSYSWKTDPQTVEKAAISNAKKFGYNTDDLQVIHIDDVDPASDYRMNLTTKTLEKIPHPEI